MHAWGQFPAKLQHQWHEKDNFAITYSIPANLQYVTSTHSVSVDTFNNIINMIHVSLYIRKGHLQWFLVKSFTMFVN